jgi:hypothetical protein
MEEFGLLQELYGVDSNSVSCKSKGKAKPTDANCETDKLNTESIP